MADIERVRIPDPDRPRADAYVRRRVSTVESLWSSRKLEARHRIAAERFYAAYMVGVEGVIEAAAELVHVGPAPGWMRDGYTVARLDALRDYQSAVRALGQAADCIIWTVIHDMTLDEVSRRIRSRRKDTPERVKDGLDTLADHYGIAEHAVERRIKATTP